MANEYEFVKVDVCLVDEKNEDYVRLYQQRFHRAYLDSLPNDFLQTLIAVLNKLEAKNGE